MVRRKNLLIAVTLVLMLFLVPKGTRAVATGAGAAGTTQPPALSILCSGAVAGDGQSSAGQNKDEIIRKVVAALGGEQSLAAVKTVRITGRIAFGSAPAEPLIVEMKRPGKIREELTIQGKVLTRGYDGSTGWQLNPFENDPGPTSLSADETRGISEEAEIDDPLVNYHARGNTVDLMGTEKVDGRDAYKFKVTLKNGDVHYYYYDSTSYLKVKWQAAKQMDGKEIIFESFFSDHRKVGSLMYPFLIKSVTQGEEGGQMITTEKVDLNPTIDDSRFTMPPKASK